MTITAIYTPKKVTPQSVLLSTRQVEILQYLWDFYRENDQLPPRHVVAEHFGFMPNAAESHFAALHRKGYLVRSALPGKFKFTPKARALLDKAA